MLKIDMPSASTAPWTMLAVLICCLLLTSCTTPPPAPEQGIADLDRYQQSASAYTRPETRDLTLIEGQQQSALDTAWTQQFFAPWHRAKTTLSQNTAFWGASQYGQKQGYAENLQPYSRGEWDQLVAAQQMESYPSFVRPAITVRNIAVRLLPTNRPFFLDPLVAGEGFPFDYFQNSALWAGTPLLVTHISVDGAWYFAEAGLIFGWIPADAVAWADQKFRRAYETGQYAALLHDNITLLDVQGAYLTQTHLGAIFPVAENDNDQLILVVPVRNADGHAVMRTSRVAASQAAVKPLPLTPQRLAALADTLIGQRYGWGGLYENRDCSATMRDLFAPFGIWLERNSSQQANKGGVLHSFIGLSADEKRQALLTEGIPFYTLIWFKGHIGLYLGPDPVDGEPLLLHNTWGVHTFDPEGREGRAIIGRLVVTSLRPGEERRDVARNGFYDRMLGMTILDGYVPRTAEKQ